MNNSLKLNYLSSNQETYTLLDKEGNWLNPDHKAPLTVEEVLKAFEWMMLSRRLDERMLQMQRQGRMLTFAPNMGEEALQAAMAMAMKKEDWLVPAFRSGLLMMMHGMPLHNQMLYWNGNEKGCIAPEGVNILPINITIGSQCSHAGGIGWAMRYKNIDAAAVSFIGDGGTAEGEFYEALNFATLNAAKWVCCINNNGFAISTRTILESKVQDLSSKAVAVGCHFLRVDGNDLFASYEAAKLALEHARSKEGGPVLLEFVTYRKGPHTTSDDPKVYLKPEEKAAGEAKDPFIRTKKWLLDQKAFADEAAYEKWEKEVLARCDAKIDEGIVYMEANLIPSVEEIFDHTYAKLSPDLMEQRAEAIERAKKMNIKK